jgi:hypothetical protein
MAEKSPYTTIGYKGIFSSFYLFVAPNTLTAGPGFILAFKSHLGKEDFEQ